MSLNANKVQTKKLHSRQCFAIAQRFRRERKYREADFYYGMGMRIKKEEQEGPAFCQSCEQEEC